MPAFPATEVDGVFVGNFNSGFSKQNFPGSLAMQSVPDLRFKPAARYENACASGSAAVFAARDFIAAGRGRFALVIGVEKMTATPGPAGGGQSVGRVLPQGRGRHSRRVCRCVRADCRNVFPEAWRPVRRAGNHCREEPQERRGQPLRADAASDLGFDFCRTASDKNPYVAGPLKRTDCSLVSDGAAALILADEDTARAWVLAGGKSVRFRAAAHVNEFLPLSKRDPTRFEAGAVAWNKAFEAAGLTLEDLSFVETHDCFTIAELIEYEAMGLVPEGQGARAAMEGWTQADGKLPVNRSGGLKAKGHPVGATGVSMHVMTAMQLTGRAGALQLPRADVGAVFNMGGAAVANYVSILERQE